MRIRRFDCGICGFRTEKRGISLRCMGWQRLLNLFISSYPTDQNEKTVQGNYPAYTNQWNTSDRILSIQFAKSELKISSDYDDDNKGSQEMTNREKISAAGCRKKKWPA